MASSYNTKETEHEIETNSSSYNEFLKGKLWDEKMLDISYDEATTPLENYVLYSGAFKSFDPEIKQNVIAFQEIKEKALPSYLAVYRCISFDLSNEIKLNA